VEGSLEVKDLEGMLLTTQVKASGTISTRSRKQQILS